MKTSFEYSYEVKINALRKIKNNAIYQTLIFGGAFFGVLIVLQILFSGKSIHNYAILFALLCWVICNIKIFKTYLKDCKRVKQIVK